MAITNTNSLGLVRDALIELGMREEHADRPSWTLPVVGETYDGQLSDINGFHVRPNTSRPRWPPRPAGPSPRARSAAGPA